MRSITHPSTRSGSLGRFLIFFIILFLVFCLGLLLGGTVMKNKYLKALDETREMLQKHPSSVIVIKSDVAEAVNFKPRNRHDYDWRKRPFDGLRVTDNKDMGYGSRP